MKTSINKLVIGLLVNVLIVLGTACKKNDSSNPMLPANNVSSFIFSTDIRLDKNWDVLLGFNPVKSIIIDKVAVTSIPTYILKPWIKVKSVLIS